MRVATSGLRVTEIGGSRARLGNHERPTDHSVDLHPRRGRPQRAAPRASQHPRPPHAPGQAGPPDGAAPARPPAGGAPRDHRRHRGELPDRGPRTVDDHAGDRRLLGRAGASRASSSPRCWSSWPPRAAAPGCSAGSTSTPTRGSPRCSGSRASRWSSRSSAASPSRASPGCCPRRRSGSTSTPCSRPAASTVAEPEDPRLDEADDALMTGDLDAAERRTGRSWPSAPADAAAEAGLAQVELARRVDRRGPGAALATADARPRRRGRPAARRRHRGAQRAGRAGVRPAGRLVRRTAGEDRETRPQAPGVAVHRRRARTTRRWPSARRALASALF